MLQQAEQYPDGKAAAPEAKICTTSIAKIIHINKKTKCCTWSSMREMRGLTTTVTGPTPVFPRRCITAMGWTGERFQRDTFQQPGGGHVTTANIQVTELQRYNGKVDT